MRIIDFIDECERGMLMPKDEFDKLRLELVALEAKAEKFTCPRTINPKVLDQFEVLIKLTVLGDEKAFFEALSLIKQLRAGV